MGLCNTKYLFPYNPSQPSKHAVTAQGVTYLSSAGNQKHHSIFQALTIIGDHPNHYFQSDMGHYQVRARGGTRVVLQWDDPKKYASNVAGAASNLDLFIYQPSSNTWVYENTNNLASGIPVEILSTPGSSSTWSTYYIFVQYKSGPVPNFFKLVFFRDVSAVAPSNAALLTASTTYGHANAAGAISAAAVDFDYSPGFGVTPAIVESFSSVGGTPILFDVYGNRLSQPVYRPKPVIAAPDGTCTTFFGSYDGCYRFFGTSAAAPNAAAVVALMMEIEALSPAEVKEILQLTAMDMDNPYTSGFDTGHDYATGYGFLNAYEAIKEVDSRYAPTTTTTVATTTTASTTTTSTTTTSTTAATTTAATTTATIGAGCDTSELTALQAAYAALQQELTEAQAAYAALEQELADSQALIAALVGTGFCSSTTSSAQISPSETHDLFVEGSTRR